MGAIRSGGQIFSAYREVIFFVKFVEFVAVFLLITGHEFHAQPSRNQKRNHR